MKRERPSRRGDSAGMLSLMHDGMVAPLFRHVAQRAIRIKLKGRCPMANVMKKYSISSELAQKMVDAAVAKARELGVSENVAILDDGGNLKALAGWMGPRCLPSRLRRRRRTPLCSASSLRTFSTLSRATRRFWPASPRLRV